MRNNENLSSFKERFEIKNENANTQKLLEKIVDVYKNLINNDFEIIDFSCEADGEKYDRLLYEKADYSIDRNKYFEETISKIPSGKNVKLQLLCIYTAEVEKEEEPIFDYNNHYIPPKPEYGFFKDYLLSMPKGTEEFVKYKTIKLYADEFFATFIYSKDYIGDAKPREDFKDIEKAQKWYSETFMMVVEYKNTEIKEAIEYVKTKNDESGILFDRYCEFVGIEYYLRKSATLKTSQLLRYMKLTHEISNYLRENNWGSAYISGSFEAINSDVFAIIRFDSADQNTVWDFEYTSF